MTNPSVEFSLHMLSRLRSASLFKWEAEIALVIHHWTRMPIFQNLPPSAIRQTEYHYDDQNIRSCLQVLYSLSEQELLVYQIIIIQQILPRLQCLNGVKTLPNTTLESYTFVEQLRGELGKVNKFYTYDWTFIICSLKKDGDPRLVAVTLPTYKINISFPQKFLYILGCRHHALAYWKKLGKRDILEDSRASSKFPAYANSCGLDPALPDLRNAMKIGQRLLSIEEKVSAPGISLVMTRVCRKLLKLRVLNIKQIISIVEGLLNEPDIIQNARWLSEKLLQSQKKFDDEVAKFLGKHSSLFPVQ
jgi:hypothetical protein